MEKWTSGDYQNDRSAGERQNMEKHFQILLVDDDANERAGVRFLIEKLKLPLDIKEAPNGKRAINVLENSAIDILFTDVKMPYMDGLELSSIVHARYPNIKIIIFSAYGEFDYAKRALEANAVNYLLKPVDVAEFQKVMNSVTAQCHEEDLNARQLRRRIMAERKLQWINLLTGKLRINPGMTPDAADARAVRDVHVVLVHIETQGEELSQNEPQILSLLEECIPYRYEYINIYPNSSYIIIFANLTKDELIRIARKFISQTACFGETPSLLISRAECGLDKLNDLYLQINQLRTQMCVWEAPILFAQEIDRRDQEYFFQVDAQLKKTQQAIKTHDKEQILAEIACLLNTMSVQGTIDVAFMHHIMCEVLGDLYAAWGLANSGSLQVHINRFGNCRTRASILEVYKDILETDAFAQTDSFETASDAVQKVIRIVKSDYSEDLSLDYLAACVGFAPSYLSFIFKHETGENLIKYITDYRMEQAKKLLDTGSVKIVQVAKQCGYNNASYFNRLFKNTYGITPKQYKEKGAKQ